MLLLDTEVLGSITRLEPPLDLNDDAIGQHKVRDVGTGGNILDTVWFVPEAYTPVRHVIRYVPLQSGAEESNDAFRTGLLPRSLLRCFVGIPVLFRSPCLLIPKSLFHRQRPAVRSQIHPDSGPLETQHSNPCRLQSTE